MTRLTLELPDDIVAELRHRASSANQPVEAVAAHCIEASLNFDAYAHPAIAEAVRRQRDGLSGRGVEEVFNRLDRKHDLNTKRSGR